MFLYSKIVELPSSFWHLWTFVGLCTIDCAYFPAEVLATLHSSQCKKRFQSISTSKIRNSGTCHLCTTTSWPLIQHHRIFKNDSGKILSDADLDMILDRSQMVAESLPPTASAPAVTFGKAFTAKGSNQAARSIPAPSSAAGAPLPAAATTTTMCIASTSTAGPDVASTSAAGAVGTAMLVYSKHNALSFDAQKAPGSTFMFGGLDYAKKRVRTGSNGDDVLNQIGEQVRREDPALELRIWYVRMRLRHTCSSLENCMYML